MQINIYSSWDKKQIKLSFKIISRSFDSRFDIIIKFWFLTMMWNLIAIMKENCK